MNKACGFGVSVFFLLFLAGNTATAASLYIDPGIGSLNRGDAATLAVRLDTDEAAGECINAVDGVITYTANIEPVDVSVGNSIFNLWVEKPTINREERTITFAGGIPNGYCGRVEGDPRLTNVLMEMVFRSPGFSIGGSNATSAKVAFADTSTAYINDGQGTEAVLTTFGSNISLNAKAGSIQRNPWQDQIEADQIPPEEFSISLQKDAKAFSQKYYIVFNTTDKQTGIDQYQVMEEPLTQFGSFQWGRADAPWVETRSPHVLEDQSLNSIIRVKAIDKAGNEYIANYIPDESLRSFSQGQILTYMFLVGGAMTFLLVLGIIWMFVRQLRKKRSGNNENEENKNEDRTENSSDTNEESIL